MLIVTLPLIQSAAKPDTEYSLFGGGVKGKYVSLTPGKEIVQTWALSNPSWPSGAYELILNLILRAANLHVLYEGHFATLTTTFEQSSDSTKVIWKLDGVPLGQEDELTRNIQGY